MRPSIEAEAWPNPVGRSLVRGSRIVCNCDLCRLRAGPIRDYGPRREHGAAARGPWAVPVADNARRPESPLDAAGRCQSALHRAFDDRRGPGYHDFFAADELADGAARSGSHARPDHGTTLAATDLHQDDGRQAHFFPVADARGFRIFRLRPGRPRTGASGDRERADATHATDVVPASDL